MHNKSFEHDPTIIQVVTDVFRGENLPVPPFPEPLASQLQRVAEWTFTTRSDRRSAYRLGWFIEEAETVNPADYLLVSHAGHGLNSWALHYYLVYRSLALFVQSGWGGVYMDETACVAALADRFLNVERLIASAERAAEAGRSAARKRLLVVSSDFSGPQLRWLSDKPSGGRAAAIVWSDKQDVLEAAMWTLMNNSV